MTITANGQTYTLDEATSLETFLNQRNQRIGNVVVERNGEALSPSEARDLILKDGDKLEIVRIVAGG